jgi:hypothetical protein
MRTVRLLSVALHNPSTETDPDERGTTNLDNILGLLDQAADYDPDFVSFPELCLHHATRGDGLLEDVAEPIPGTATDAVGEKARELDSYVFLPMYERNGDRCHNAAAFIGPDGEVVDVYRKVAPTTSEVESGLTPGSEVKVWETEFGRVGALICWDAQYEEIGRSLAQQDADLVFFLTLGSADHQLRNWARNHGYHVALCDKHYAQVYRPTGDVIARNGGWDTPKVEDLDLGGGEARFSFAEVNLDCNTYFRGGGFEWARELQKRYAGSVMIHAYNDDGLFVIESVDEEVSLAEMEAEIDGMTQLGECEDEARTTARAAADCSPLTPKYEDRP